jgi:transcriptional regulator with XRE-family HTH domain
MTMMSEQPKQAIKDSGQSHNAIAKESGVARRLIDRFMKGEIRIRIDTADHIAEYLGLELSKQPAKTSKAKASAKKGK